eukprot:7063438-Prymnesium_polylepis.1
MAAWKWFFRLRNTIMNLPPRSGSVARGGGVEPAGLVRGDRAAEAAPMHEPMPVPWPEYQ